MDFLRGFDIIVPIANRIKTITIKRRYNMFEYDRNNSVIIGPAGNLKICSGDEVSLKLAMLLQGECTKVGPLQAAKNFNYSKARYYQIRNSFDQEGVDALIRKKTDRKSVV